MKSNTSNTAKSEVIVAAKVAKPVVAIVHESKKADPVKWVREFFIKNHKKMRRSEAVRAAVKAGVAFYTARTQYQKVYANGFKLPKAA